MCSHAEVVSLNVGGVKYTTTRSTLTQFGDSMIGAMFSGRYQHLVRDLDGNVFIDRDGPMFRHVLNFLRTGRLTLPGDFRDHDMLEAEADFFQIEPLVDAVRASRIPLTPECSGPAVAGVRPASEALLEMYQVKCDFEPKMGGYVVLCGARWILLSLPLAESAANELNSNGAEFQTVYIDERDKMEVVSHLQTAGWTMMTSSFAVAFSPVIDKYDHARCYTTNKYVWTLKA